jgi:hypothetical protein
MKEDLLSLAKREAERVAAQFGETSQHPKFGIRAQRSIRDTEITQDKKLARLGSTIGKFDKQRKPLFGLGDWLTVIGLTITILVGLPVLVALWRYLQGEAPFPSP